MATVKVVPGSLTEAYKKRQGDFAPNLVGFQFTEGSSFFTFGNFEITTNLSQKLTKDFQLGGQWSEYYTLGNLNLNQNQSEIFLSNEIFVKLNFNPYDVSRYVYFGSFYEYARVAVEQIIQKWKGSLYLDPTKNTNTPVNTVLSFNYDSGIDVSTFLIPKNIATNTFNLILDENQDFVDLTEGDIYNLSRDYTKYVIWPIGSNVDYEVMGYTGSTDSYPYIRIKTKGNPFPSLTASTFGQLIYHLKPNSTEVELFFQQLTDFEGVLLNRLTQPQYTSSFTVPQQTDGLIYYTTRSFTWPVSDGYNIDIDTLNYGLYVEDLLATATQFDENQTDLVSRRFVSESIHEFDTNGGGDPVYGMKVTKLLKIYGREFDEVKKYIDGISFANVVTYNKLDNTSDELIKILARTLGLETLLTVTTDNFDLIQINKTTTQTPFSGYSRSLSAKELDIELWRRIVINAWWLFKSKGTRKVIEFFLNLFNIPECMISLNEYIYLAEDRLNLDSVFTEIQNFLYPDGTLEITQSDYPVDSYGFPEIPTETNDNYFQMGGFWYNGGTESTIGNNPHIGPYDYGKNYFDQFRCFIPGFNQVLTGTTSAVTYLTNYFVDYGKGTFNPLISNLPAYSSSFGEILNTTNGKVKNVVVDSAGVTTSSGVNAPLKPKPDGDGFTYKISFTAGDNSVCRISPCPTTTNNNTDGIVYVDNTNTTPLLDQKCCTNFWLPNPYTNAVPFLCFWCPPPSNVIEVTNVTQLLTINPNLTLTEQTTLNQFFTTSSVLYVTGGYDTPVDDQNCCTNYGGNWVADSTNVLKPGGYICTKVVTPPCSNQIVVTPPGGTGVLYTNTTPQQLVSQACCSSPNVWTDGTVTIYDGTSIFKSDKLDPNLNILSQQGIGTPFETISGLRLNWCSTCSHTLALTQSINGPTPPYLDRLVDQTTGDNLSPECCTPFGFSYGNNECYYCPIDLIYQDYDPGTYAGTVEQIGLITDSNNVDLSQYCCGARNGYWYVNPLSGTDSPKCNTCPDYATGGYSVNTVEDAAPGGDMIDLVTYNGQNLSYNCCFNYYRSLTNNQNVSWDPINNRCYIKSQTPSLTINQKGLLGQNWQTIRNNNNTNQKAVMVVEITNNTTNPIIINRFTVSSRGTTKYLGYDIKDPLYTPGAPSTCGTINCNNDGCNAGNAVCRVNGYDQTFTWYGQNTTADNVVNGISYNETYLNDKENIQVYYSTSAAALTTPVQISAIPGITLFGTVTQGANTWTYNTIPDILGSQIIPAGQTGYFWFVYTINAFVRQPNNTSLDMTVTTRTPGTSGAIGATYLNNSYMFDLNNLTSTSNYANSTTTTIGVGSTLLQYNEGPPPTKNLYNGY